MTRKFAVVLLEMQFSAIRESQKRVKLFAKLGKNEEVELRGSPAHVYMANFSIKL